MYSFSVARQPADPDHLSEHWRPTADPHRLANATQVGGTHSYTPLRDVFSGESSLGQEQGCVLRQEMGEADPREYHGIRAAQPYDLWGHSPELSW